MAMLQMQRITIYALKKDRKQLLEALQRRGVIEVSDILPEDNVFYKSDVTNAKSGFDRNIASAKDAVNILEQYIPTKKSMLSVLNGRSEVTAEVYDAFHKKYEAVVRAANRIQSLSKEIAENKAEISKYLMQVEILTPWVGLDIPMNFSGTKFTKSFIGTLPKAWDLETIYGKLAEYMPLNVDIISTSAEQTCVFVLCTREHAERVYEVLRQEEFTLPSITFDRAPAEQLEHLKSLIVEAEAAIKKAEEEIISFGGYKDELMFLQDYDAMRSEKYEVIGHLLQSRNTFILTGFIPRKDADKLKSDMIGKFDVAVEFEEPADPEEVPVLLNNNGFSKPLEGVLAGYSLPGKGEIDPTMVMSLFYYMLFGLMLSDAGYGALMVAGCAFGLMKFRKTMEPSMRNTLKMYLFCGISTVFWGIMFGSFFGDIIDVVARSFFGRTAATPVIAPLWFFPVNEPMRMLSFAMLIGLIHLLTGLILKAYQLMLQKDLKAVLYDVVTWFVLVAGSTILLLSMEMMKNILGIDITIPAVMVKVTTVLVLLSALTIIATNGRESKNPFKRFLKGLYALYGITGYLSDVLSYSRLLALGLATGIIGSVINQMASMTAGIVLGPLWFLIIVIFGHTLNIAINALGAYVHTNRLQYVEFFGKFYEGGGRIFNPFHMKTKYYKIKEKE